MTMPDVWCEIAFAKDPGNSSPLWRDVSDDVEWAEGVTSSRRRSHELDEVQPGTLSLILNNPDGRYTAGNTASPHYPNVKINRPIRIRARWPVSPNLLLQEQARGVLTDPDTGTALFSASQGSLAQESSIVPAGQTTSIRWAAGTLPVGAQMRVGSTPTTSATDQAIPVEPGVTYSLRCQARRDASVAVTMAVRIRYFTADGVPQFDVTGTGVAMSTTFQALSLVTTAPAGAAFARVVLHCTVASASAVVIYSSAWQLEAAAAPTAWVSPGVEYIRYTGLVDRWPHAWQNGVLGKVSLTATDVFKILSRRQTRNEALTQEVLATAPVFYYPLNEADDASAAGNKSATSQPALTAQPMGNGGGSAALGAAGGPLGSTMATFAPVDEEGGTGLAASPLLTAMGGGAAMTIAAWISVGTSPTPHGGFMYLGNGDLGLFGGTLDSTCMYVTYEPGGLGLVLTTSRTGAGVVGPSYSVTLTPGELYMVVVVCDLSTGTLRAKIYLDGVEVYNALETTTATSYPIVRRISVGGIAHAPSVRVEAYAGKVGHFAGWNRALSAPEIASLYAAGSVTSELSGTRVGNLLQWADQSAARVDPGLSLLDTSLYGTDDGPLRAILAAALSENGLFFIDRSGAPVFHDRQWRQSPGAVDVIALTADQCGPDLAFVIDDTLLINDVTIARGSAETRVTDDASVEEYGQYAKTVDTQLASDADAINRGNQLLSRYAEPSPRAGQIAVEGASLATLWPSLLGSEIDQQILVTGLPASAPSSSLPLWCEGVQDVITDQTWKFTFDTSPMSSQNLILNDPAFGLLDSNTLGW